MDGISNGPHHTYVFGLGFVFRLFHWPAATYLVTILYHKPIVSQPRSNERRTSNLAY